MANFTDITPDQIKTYEAEIAERGSQATAKRKMSSLKRFFDWAHKEGHVDENPVQSITQKAPKKASQKVDTQEPNKGSRLLKYTFRGSVIIGLIIIIWLLSNKIQISFPFVSTPTEEITEITPTDESVAILSPWKIITKMNLQDGEGDPLVGPQAIIFKLYESEGDNQSKWESSSLQVTPDAEGDILISLEDVPVELFFENERLFLSAETTQGEISQRLPVTTANIPANLQGYFPADPEGALPHTIPVLSEDGSLLLATEAPAIKATAGNLLVEGQTVTLSTPTGSDGDIVINPDGAGGAQFLFEGASNDFLSAQAPNLVSGSLYYGLVANNATGYNLIELQSGSNPITRFSVDALGNTQVSGELNVDGDISTSDTTRLSSTGALSNITDYEQTEGNFAITQDAGDAATITKKASALSDLLTITLDERGYPNSIYSALTLRRYNGAQEAMALLVDEGNAQFNGQVRLGRYATNPTAIGTGSLVYNSSDNSVYVWDGSTWSAVGSGSGSSYWTQTSGVLYPATITDDLAIGGTDSTAPFFVNDSGTITFTSDTNLYRSAANTLATDDGLVVGANLDVNGSANDIAGTLNLSGDTLSSSTDLTIDPTGGGVKIGTGTPGDIDLAGDDLYVTQDLEVDGVIYGDGTGITNVTADDLSCTDCLDFTEFADSMTLDASTDIALGSYTLSSSGTGALDFNSTGQVSFAGNVDAENGLDVTTANLTVGGANFSVVPGTGNITTAGDLAVNGGDITSSSDLTITVVDDIIFTDAQVTSIQLSDVDSTLPNGNVGIVDAINDAYSAATGGGDSWWDVALGVLSPVNSTLDVAVGGTATSSAKFYVSAATGDITTDGDLAVNGGDITTSASTFNLVTSSATTVNFAQSAETISMGSLDGTATIRNATTGITGNLDVNGSNHDIAGTLNLSGSDLTTSTATFSLLNTTATTLNFAGATTALSIGADTGTTTINNATTAVTGNLDVDGSAHDIAGTLNLSGSDLTTSTATFNLLNTTATTLNVGEAATAVSLGADTGTTTINNATTAVTGNLDVGGSSNDIAGTLNLSGNSLTSTGDLNIDAADGDITFADGDVLIVGGHAAGGGYNVFADSGDSKDEAAIAADNDLYIGGDLEVDGTIYDSTGSVVAGYWTLSSSDLYATSTDYKIGIGTSSPISRLHVATNTTTPLGKSALIVDQLEDEDILTASASGSTKLTLTNSGTLKLYNASSTLSNTSGDITIDAASDLISFSGDNLGNLGYVSASDQVKVGNFASDPTNIGEGSIYYNTTDDYLYYYTGAGWTQVGSGAGESWWGEALGVLSPVNSTLDLAIGGTATSSAKFHVNASTGDVIADGYVAAGGVLQVGSTSTVAYSRLGTGTTGHSLDASNDLLISADLEVDGTLYVDGGTIANSDGTGTITFTGAPTTGYNTLSASSWLVENTANVGLAALMVNQTKSGDLFTASASGTTKFRIANNGNVTIDGSGTMLTVGSGTGKIDVGTVDPVYNINGEKYATYMAGMIGVKEEITGSVETNQYVPGLGYKHTIDFTNQNIGSDLWLFGKTTDIGEHINDLVVLLSPANNSRVWYEIDEDNYTLSIYSSRPTNISYRLTAPRFDAADWTNYNTNPESFGFLVGEDELVGSGENNQEIPLLSDFEIIKQGADYVIQTITGEVIEGVEAIANLAAANIKAGAIQTKEFTTDSFLAFQGTVDNLLVKTGLVSPYIETQVISPMADSDIKIDLDNSLDKDGSSFGKFVIEGENNEDVASIDAQGNATFSGTVESENVQTNEITAGKIYADEIIARTGVFADLKAATSSAVTREEIEELLRAVDEDQQLLAEATSWTTTTATDSANLDYLATADLYVTNQAAINSLSVSGFFTVGNDFTVQTTQDEFGGYLATSINTLSAPLEIQSLALAPIEIMSGLVRIDTNGDVTIEGNLYVAGKIESSGLTLKEKETDEKESEFANLLELQNLDGNTVASVDASGSAFFDKLVLAGSEATISASLLEGLVSETNATAGESIIPEGTREITIRSPKITDYTLVYVTPTSSTENNVLYVKEKGRGYFVVGFNKALDIDVKFNWWVIDVTQVEGQDNDQ